MEVTLTPLQTAVDIQIDARITRIMRAAYEMTNRLPSGRLRRKILPVTPPQEVIDLLALRQSLYKGALTPDEISSEITGGDIQHKFLNS